MFNGLENRSLAGLELKIDEALLQISQSNLKHNSVIGDFLNNNEVIATLLRKARSLESQKNGESILKAKSIRLIIEESKLAKNFNELKNYLHGIKNVNNSRKSKSLSFYQETLNRPRSIIDKILHFFGWGVTTETALYFDALLEAVAAQLEIENRPNIGSSMIGTINQD